MFFVKTLESGTNEVGVSAHIDDSRAVGAYETSGALAQQLVFDSDHVLLWDALSDAHNQGHLCINGLNNGRSRERWGHINHSCIGPSALSCLGSAEKRTMH